MKNLGFAIGVLGGLGLGLLLGSEFAGSEITIAGALLVAVALCSMAFLFYTGKR